MYSYLEMYFKASSLLILSVGQMVMAGKGNEYNGKCVSMTAVTVGARLKRTHIVYTRRLAHTKHENMTANHKPLE